MSAAARVTAPELLARLKRHYIKPGDAMPGGIFVSEVAHGGMGGRRVDALYVGFFSSRGHHLVGHELKVSRADWLHELEQIEKAEVWASQCHAWYAVAPSTQIIRPEELPHGWGLMVIDPATKTRLRVVEKATVREEVQPSWSTTHSILKQLDTLQAGQLRDARDKAQADVAEEMAQLRRQAAETLLMPASNDRADNLERLVEELSHLLDVHIVDGHWAAPGQTTLEELRGPFADYLRARRDGDAALQHRLAGLAQIDRQLESALAAVRDAQTVMGQHAIERRR